MSPAPSPYAEMPSLSLVQFYPDQRRTGPGGATDRQVGAVRTLGFVGAVRTLGFVGDPATLSEGEASTILAARDYVLGVSNARGREPATGTSRQMVAWTIVHVLCTPHLRRRVLAWNRRSFRRGGNEGGARPRRDEHYAEIEAKIGEIMASLGGTA